METSVSVWKKNICKSQNKSVNLYLEKKKMIKEDSIVFAPKLEIFARVVDHPNEPSKSSIIRPDGSEANFRQKDEELILLFENSDPKTLIEDYLRCNVFQAIAKIARFLWRRILVLEGNDKARQKEIEQLKEDLARVAGHHKVH